MAVKVLIYQIDYLPRRCIGNTID